MASTALSTLRAFAERLPALIGRANVPAFGGAGSPPPGAPGAGSMTFTWPSNGYGGSSPWWKPNWFQLGVQSPNGDAAMRVASVYTCVSVIAQEIARIDLHLWRLDPTTGKRTQNHANFERVLRRPNAYQTRSDFWLHVMMSLLLRGNAYAVATRREGQIVGLHPVPESAIMPVIDQNTGEVFYRLGQWQLEAATERDPAWDNYVPAEDVLHLRLFCPSHPLIGMSPLMACGPAIAQSAAISSGSAAFFGNMSRPSGILTGPEKVILGEKEVQTIKERWRGATTEAALGSVMVLQSGYKWEQLTMTAVDAQLVEQYRMSKEDIAGVFRVPLHMLGDLSKATFSNVDAMQRSFIVSCLGFYLKHIEDAVGDFFGLSVNEYAEFDVENAMMRPEFKERMEAFARAVQGGVYAPNEVRAEEHLPAVKGGDTVFLQRQMAPVDQIVDAGKTGAIKPAKPKTPPPDDDEDGDEDQDGDSKALGLMRARRAAMQRIIERRAVLA